MNCDTPIMFTMHVFYVLTFISEGGGDDGGVTGKNTAKPVTTVRQY